MITKAELPPRARRIPQLIGRWRGGKGTTSACAENTCTGSGRSCTPQNYLRVRGEYITGQSRLVNYPELPPRARRIQSKIPSGFTLSGTTSACAENTPRVAGFELWLRNYLRVRGEYPPATTGKLHHLELPPRARRIRLPLGRASGIPGTTSACAENTRILAPRTNAHQNYLRVRGEYHRLRCRCRGSTELPPRARRIRHGQTPNGARGGTTSACAENTFPACPRICLGRNYLRVRGEYTSSHFGWDSGSELPPRARRIQRPVVDPVLAGGTTSACAENTSMR